MKNVNEIQIIQNIQHDFTKDQKIRVRDFIVSIFSLFADYRNEFTKEDFFKSQCRIYANEISAMSESEYFLRLDKIKKIVAVSNTPKLLGNYKTANGALAIACMPIEHINHDYALAYPINYNTGELKRIAESLSTTTQHDIEVAEKALKNMKDLFK
jgi:hypothetical protein